MSRYFRLSLLLIFIVILSISSGCKNKKVAVFDGSETNLITFSNIHKVWENNKGKGVTVAIIDWQFDLKGKEAEKYIHPVSLIENEAIGELKPWHGEWMAEIVHIIAPKTKIIPIKARGLEDRDYEKHIIEGIKYAADHGAVAVSSSMGMLEQSDALKDAINYAEAKGTIFINVHPEYYRDDEGNSVLLAVEDLDKRIIHPGVVTVPDYQVEPENNRDIYTWPYDLEANWKDGWGYSNAPPVVVGIIALLKSTKPELTPEETRQIIRNSTYDYQGFAVIDAEKVLSNKN